MWKILRSFNLAIILISALIFICILYVLGPQGIDKGLAEPGWEEVVLYSILTLLVINVSLCSGNKIKGIFKSKTHAKLGSLIFHLSLVLIFAGSLYGRLTRFEGYVELGEGQEFIEGHNSYLTLKECPLFNERHGGWTIRLNNVLAFTDYKDRTKDYASQITIFKDSKTRLDATIKPNKPISYNGFSIYQSKYFGNALLFKFTDRAGRENTGYVNLSLSDKEKEDSITDFSLPGTTTKVMVTLKKDNVEILKKKVFPGQSLNTEAGTLSLLDIKKWSGLTIVKDLSIYPVFTGFVTGIIGLVWMYLSGR